MHRITLFTISAAAATVLTAAAAHAQHPIDVQRDTADGDYMAALISYDKMPQRIATAQSRVAAAKSAWALSLPDRALAEYDGAIRQGGLEPEDLARIYLGKGIIEHQEGRNEVAMLDAQKSMEQLHEASPLRSQVLALWGESLAAMKQFAPAEEKYQQAMLEAEPEGKPELAYLLGETQFQLGKYEDARLSLEKVPLRNDRTAEAIRLLAQVALQQDKPSLAAFWLGKGRHEYPDQFLDSWTDYIMVKGAIDTGDLVTERTLRIDAQKRYAASDPWLALLNAAAEEYEWKQLNTEQKLEPPFSQPSK